MPSSSSRIILGGLTASQFQRFLPQTWKTVARPVLEKLKTKEVSMLDDLVRSLKKFVSQGHLSDALKTFSLVRRHALANNSLDALLHSSSTLLLSCISLKAFRPGTQLHAQVIVLGLEGKIGLAPKIATFYSTFNFLDVVHIIAENSNTCEPVPWNVLISSYVKNELFEEALAAYKEMVGRGIRPDAFTYPSVLKACSEKMDLALGRIVHGSIVANSQGQNLYVRNALISMYGKLGELDLARWLFDEMLERDAVSWNAIISCYASRGMWQEAFELFEEIRVSDSKASYITWNAVAGGCLTTGNFKGALDLLSQMRTYGMSFDPVAIIIGLGACSHIGAIRLGKEIHGCAVRGLLDAFDNVQNALITMYARCRDLKRAFVVFQLIEEKGIIAWNSMISGFAHMDMSEEASFLLREMVQVGPEPNYVTLASILPLCARVANLQHGKELHCYILKRELFREYLLLWNSLVDMYARSGKIVAAKRVFGLMTERDKVTYTSLIAGYGSQGEGRSALALFEEMIKFEIKPDHVTMVAALSACSHSGLVHEGQMLFEKMQRIYGIIPRLEHFACMVDLYGRAGMLNKARSVIQTMPYKPTAAMWATLLGACRIQGNTDVGEWAAEKLLEMKPENSGYYVLIANMYAAAGCWSKLAEVRTFMRGLGVKKAPGCAWVDVGSGISPFLVEDTTNPQSNEIYPMLDGLSELMKDAGCSVGQETSSEDEVLEEIG